VRQICDDLEAEHEVLEALVAGVKEVLCDSPTPAEPWTVRDQIAHLAYFDVLSIVDVTDAETRVELHQPGAPDAARGRARGADGPGWRVLGLGRREREEPHDV
jgi:hypothetical protein